MDKREAVALYRDLIRCGNALDLRRYDSTGVCLDGPEDGISSFFRGGGFLTSGLEQGRTGTKPVLVGTSFGMVWGIGYLKEENAPFEMYVLGPVFYFDVARKVIEKEVRAAFPGATVEQRSRLMEALQSVPVVGSPSFARYLLMLHFCLNGEKLNASDIYQMGGSYAGDALPGESGGRDRHRLYMAEQAMLRMVENGDLDYSKALSDSIGMSRGVMITSKDPLRSSKNSVIIFTTLASRAAMRGGLPPEEAYSVGDAYIQEVENAGNFNEVAAIPGRMYEDFIHRVFRCRRNPRYSSEIQRCCDYIEYHIGENVRARTLADLTGYTEYYLTEKFKKETGYTITNYAKFVKVERAKTLLETTNDSMQEIADALAFSSRNYFTKVFTEVAGMSPTDYRKKKTGGGN